MTGLHPRYVSVYVRRWWEGRYYYIPGPFNFTNPRYAILINFLVKETHTVIQWKKEPKRNIRTQFTIIVRPIPMFVACIKTISYGLPGICYNVRGWSVGKKKRTFLPLGWSYNQDMVEYSVYFFAGLSGLQRYNWLVRVNLFASKCISPSEKNLLNNMFYNVSRTN